MRRTLQRLTLFAVVGFSLGPVACSNHYVTPVKYPDSGATLEGTVTYAGQKVRVALIIAQGEKDYVQAFMSDDGRYKIENAPLGEVKLAVNTAAGKGRMIGRRMAQSRGKGEGPLPPVIDVPAKYGEPNTSGITTTINPGANTFDIVIPK
jgi:hypothetical protein